MYNILNYKGQIIQWLDADTAEAYKFRIEGLGFDNIDAKKGAYFFFCGQDIFRKQYCELILSAKELQKLQFEGSVIARGPSGKRDLHVTLHGSIYEEI